MNEANNAPLLEVVLGIDIQLLKIVDQGTKRKVQMERGRLGTQFQWKEWFPPLEKQKEDLALDHFGPPMGFG